MRQGGGKGRRANERGEKPGGGEIFYPAYDSIVAGEVGFTVLAAEDLVRVEVDVVGEPHPCCLAGGRGDRSRGAMGGGASFCTPQQVLQRA